MLPLVTIALVFSIHLSDIEKFVLGVWCIYCVISLGVITLITLLVIGKVIADDDAAAAAVLFVAQALDRI